MSNIFICKHDVPEWNLKKGYVLRLTKEFTVTPKYTQYEFEALNFKQDYLTVDYHFLMRNFDPIEKSSKSAKLLWKNTTN